MTSIFKLALFCALCTQTAFAQCNASLFAGGAGTEANPYQISTPQQLQNLDECRVSGNKNTYYILTGDINLSSYLSGSSQGWQPIRNFSGKFNGNGHKVSGLWINSSSENLGLFGNAIAEAEIKNIGVETDNAKGGVTSSSKDSRTGSLVGSNNGTISNSYAIGNTKGNRSGSLVGYNENGTISGCHAAGNATSIVNSWNEEYAGGLVGRNGSRGTISNSYATGNATNSGVFSNFSSGEGSSTDVGGLVGYNEGTIINSYAVGSVINSSPDTQINAGGLVGLDYAYIVGSYYDKQTTGRTDTGAGEGKTTAEMKTKATYAGWDFEAMWEINPAKNNGYPTQYWQNPNHLANATVAAVPSQTWTGSPITSPKPSVTFKGSSLAEGVDFEYAYENNTQIGTATIRIIGRGSYQGFAKSVEFTIVAASCGTGFSSGNGTEANPYKITDAKSLNAMNNCLGNANVGKYYELQNDIDLSSYLANTSTGWLPIGMTNWFIRGKFNGNGHKVSGLWINRPLQNEVGLFGEVYEAEIKNIGVEIDNAKGGVTGGCDVGGLVGSSFENGGKVSNSYAIGKVTGNCYVGGLVGYNWQGSEVSDSYAIGSVTGNSDVGGLVGYNYGSVGDGHEYGATITNSYAAGSVTGGGGVGGLVGASRGKLTIISNSHATSSVTGSNNVGGLVGILTDSVNVSNSYAEGNVTGNNYVGGLVGNSDGHIDDSHATGNVAGNGYVGGLVGYNTKTDHLLAHGDGAISNSYATGSVTGTGNHVGGLVGYSDGKVSNSYAAGSVTGSGNYVGGVAGSSGNTISNSYAIGNVAGKNYVGGVAGSSGDTISNSYATGSVTGSGNDVGGLVGHFSRGGGSSYSYYDKETTGRTDADKGTPKTTAEMKTKSTYNGWDFENTWYIVANFNSGYPVLLWQLIGRTNLQNATISSVLPQQYTSFAIEPDAFTVTFNGSTLAKDIDYEISYSNNRNAGAAKIAVLGKGSYYGSVEKTFEITKKNISITGSITAIDREYNGTATVEIIGGTLVGVFSGDDVTAKGTVASKAVGNNKAMAAITLAGADAGNYNLDQPAGTAGITVNITPKHITITGVTATDNSNGTATVELKGGTLVGVEGGDVVGFALGTGTVASSGDKAVITNITLTGADAGNYTLMQPTVKINATVAAVPSQTWTGSPITPKPTVSFKGTTLTEGTHFEYAYNNNTQIGTATIIITGKGFYQGLANEVAFTIVAASCGTGFAGGAGTAANPYKITDAKSLDALGNCLGSSNANKYYELQNDIDLSGYIAGASAGWQPIGKAVTNSSFRGKFNGNGHKVFGLWINRPLQSEVGLFGLTYIAEIKNIGVEIDDAKGGVTGNEDVGGLVGYNLEGTISNSYAAGNVTGTGNDVGGLVGYNIDGAINNSYATGNVTGTGNDVGGLAGCNSDGAISNSYATGSVTGNEDVGGLAGYNSDGAISNSYATGSVTGNEDVGGLVGYNSSDGTISNSYATGNVEGNKYIGGLVGYNSSGNTKIINSYYDKETTDRKDTGKGTPKTTEEMKTQSTYEGWDFAGIWAISVGKNNGYPYLRWQTSTPITRPRQIASSNRNLIVKTSPNSIILENLPKNTKVEVYNLQGKRIYSTTSHSPLATSLTIKVKTGVYVLKAGSQAMRVAVR